MPDGNSERKNTSVKMAVMPQTRSEIPGHMNTGML